MADMEEEYFDAYDDLTVQLLMLRDKPRLDAYNAALKHLSDEGILQNSIVLDVGCGTGILSLMAAKHGAKKVYAVEASGMARHADRIIATNGYNHIITVLQQTVETLDLREKVDVIVSEWMGFYLLHEGMLGSVLNARDKWLKPGGLLLPSTATITASPVSMNSLYAEKVDAWSAASRDLGFDFTSMMPIAQRMLTAQPEVGSIVTPEQCLAPPQEVLQLNLNTIHPDELFRLTHRVEFRPPVQCEMHGIALWFRCMFPGGVILCTAPTSPPTHWKQSVCMLPMKCQLDAGDCVPCHITLSVDAVDQRRYTIDVMLGDDDDDDED